MANMVFESFLSHDFRNYTTHTFPVGGTSIEDRISIHSICWLQVGKQKNGKYVVKVSQLRWVNTRKIKEFKSFLHNWTNIAIRCKRRCDKGKRLQDGKFPLRFEYIIIIFHHQSTTSTPTLIANTFIIIFIEWNNSCGGAFCLIGFEVGGAGQEPNWIMAWLRSEDWGAAGDDGRHRGLIYFQSHVSFIWSDDRMDCLAFLSTNC